MCSPSLGSPGPPGNVKVEEITDTTAQLSWKEGTDNHSPVISYAIQARTPFSVGWQTVTTGKGRGGYPPCLGVDFKALLGATDSDLSELFLCSA